MNYSEKKKLAQEVPIRLLLEHEGIQVRKNVCLSPFREETMPSFHIYPRTNTWCDYGLAGASHIAGDGINLIEQLHHCSFKEAVDYILKVAGGTGLDNLPMESRKIAKHPVQGTGHIIDQVTVIRHPALVRFLRSRRIPLDIANRYCSELHYTLVTQSEGSLSYFAVGFPNDNGGWVARSAPNGKGKGFKGVLLSPGITTIRLADGQVTESAYLFEGFLNFLSWCVLYGDVNRDVFVLNSANYAHFLKGLSESGTKELYFYKDNDKRGDQAFRDVLADSGCQVYDCSGPYSDMGLDDLNDYLCSL